VLFASWIANIWSPLTIPVESLLVIAGVAAILGHIFPFYLQFKGGKGVNTALGVMITLLPIYALIATLIFLGILGIFRYVSLASMIASVSLFASVLCGRYLFHQYVPLLYIIVAFFVAGVVIYAHRANISRLLQGTEYRVSFVGKKEGKRP
jgi:glycerol-3-phosphate acyltransferase PlsY